MLASSLVCFYEIDAKNVDARYYAPRTEGEGEERERTYELLKLLFYTVKIRHPTLTSVKRAASTANSMRKFSFSQINLNLIDSFSSTIGKRLTVDKTTIYDTNVHTLSDHILPITVVVVVAAIVCVGVIIGR